MEWKYLMQGKGQNVESFTQEFREQESNLGIQLDSPGTIKKYIGALHIDINYYFLLIKPTNIEERV